jgi:GntR family transcriptional regulator, rspAB operon transcriptional repressor
MPYAVESSSLASEAYSVVRQRILRGELALGQAISRRRIAQELGMSFLPVTEALLRLEFEGLLESRPRAGTRVRIPSPEDVSGHYVVREALEIQAALLCSERATAAERTDLRRLAIRVDALSMQSERAMYVVVHHKLHYRIAECARCEALTEAIEKTHALTSIWFCVMRKPAITDSPTRHQDLVAAIFSGDSVAAAAAVREHLTVGRQRTLEVLEPYFRLRKASGRRFRRIDRAAAAVPAIRAAR